MAVDRSLFVAAVLPQEGYNSSTTHHLTVTTVAYENSRPGIATGNDRWEVPVFAVCDTIPPQCNNFLAKQSIPLNVPLILQYPR